MFGTPRQRTTSKQAPGTQVATLVATIAAMKHKNSDIVKEAIPFFGTFFEMVAGWKRLLLSRSQVL